jgi:iron-sulfur cluster repair protein YtfE (RIC family)
MVKKAKAERDPKLVAQLEKDRKALDSKLDKLYKASDKFVFGLEAHTFGKNQINIPKVIELAKQYNAISPVIDQLEKEYDKLTKRLYPA